MKTDRIEISKVILCNYKPTISINPKALFLSTDDIVGTIRDAGYNINGYWCSKLLRALSFPCGYKKVDGKTSRGFFVVANSSPDILDIENRLDVLSNRLLSLQSREKPNANPHELGTEVTHDYSSIPKPVIGIMQDEGEVVKHIADNWDYYRQFMTPVLLDLQKTDPDFYTISSFKKRQLLENAGFRLRWICDHSLQQSKVGLQIRKVTGKSFNDRLDAVTNR